jgi:hypothetical protein
LQGGEDIDKSGLPWAIVYGHENYISNLPVKIVLCQLPLEISGYLRNGVIALNELHSAEAREIYLAKFKELFYQGYEEVWAKQDDNGKTTYSVRIKPKNILPDLGCAG